MSVNPGAVRFWNESSRDVAINLRCACVRLGIDVHPKKLEVEPVKVGNVWDEVHEIRKLHPRLVRRLDLQAGMKEENLP